MWEAYYSIGMSGICHFDFSNLNQARIEAHKHCTALLSGCWKSLNIQDMGCVTVRCAFKTLFLSLSVWHGLSCYTHLHFRLKRLVIWKVIEFSLLLLFDEHQSDLYLLVYSIIVNSVIDSFARKIFMSYH